MYHAAISIFRTFSSITNDVFSHQNNTSILEIKTTQQQSAFYDFALAESKFF